MALDQQTEMTQADVDELLGRHETGVLSLARRDEPYAIPISYGYDTVERRFYLRLVSTPESEKRRFLSSSPECRLVVYEEGDQIYRSVVVVGHLEAVAMEDLTVELIEQYGGRNSRCSRSGRIRKPTSTSSPTNSNRTN